jgi:hypothetical protein
VSILDAARERLCWDPSRGGAVTHRGRTVRLAAPPDLGRGPVYAVDYVPGCVYCVTRQVGAEPAQLEPDERAAADALLREAVPTVPGAL